MWRRAAPSERQADLPHPFEHRDQRDVGDAGGADEQRDAAEEEEEGVEVALHAGPDPPRLGRRRHLEQGRIGRTEGQRELPGDQVGGADAGLHLDRPRALEPEVAGCGALGDHDRTEQRRLAGHAGDDPDDGVEAVAEEDRRLVLDAGDVQLLGDVGAHQRHPVGPGGMAGVR
jgi:hypothetical protein